MIIAINIDKRLMSSFSSLNAHLSKITSQHGHSTQYLQDDSVSSVQVDALSTRSGGQTEDESLALRSVFDKRIQIQEKRVSGK